MTDHLKSDIETTFASLPLKSAEKQDLSQALLLGPDEFNPEFLGRVEKIIKKLEKSGDEVTEEVRTVQYKIKGIKEAIKEMPRWTRREVEADDYAVAKQFIRQALENEYEGFDRLITDAKNGNQPVKYEELKKYCCSTFIGSYNRQDFLIVGEKRISLLNLLIQIGDGANQSNLIQFIETVYEVVVTKPAKEKKETDNFETYSKLEVESNNYAVVKQFIRQALENEYEGFDRLITDAKNGNQPVKYEELKKYCSTGSIGYLKQGDFLTVGGKKINWENLLKWFGKTANQTSLRQLISTVYNIIVTEPKKKEKKEKKVIDDVATYTKAELVADNYAIIKKFIKQALGDTYIEFEKLISDAKTHGQPMPYKELIKHCSTSSVGYLKQGDFLTVGGKKINWGNLLKWFGGGKNQVGLMKIIEIIYQVPIKFLTEEEKDTIVLDKIKELQIEDAIALFGQDSFKLQLYLQHAFPDMSPEEMNRIIIVAFKGLCENPTVTREEKYLKYGIKLPMPTAQLELENDRSTTDKSQIKINGQASAGVPYVFIAGPFARLIKVKKDGSWEAIVPLKIGQLNDIRIMGVDTDKQIRSRQSHYPIMQTTKADDVAALFQMLSRLKNNLLAEATTEPKKRELFVESAKDMLIKEFMESFAEGEKYIEDLKKQMDSPVVVDILDEVLQEFREELRDREYPLLNPEEPLFTFQKYAHAKLNKKYQDGLPGFVLSFAAGLGKTRTTEAFLADKSGLVITPNNMVSFWGEEAAKILQKPDVTTIQNMSYKERKALLKDLQAQHVVTNIQFLQDISDEEIFELLSRFSRDGVLVGDEGHSFANFHTNQTKGFNKLLRRFLLLVTATPAKNPKELCRLFHQIFPDDERFKSDKAFTKAFPPTDPASLKALNLLYRQYVIRFRKQDVMKEFDLDKPPQAQKNRLPRKRYINPAESGEYELHYEQAQAIYEMFLNWPEWCRKYGHYIPKDQANKEDGVWVGDQLSKKHALRKIMNNPRFIGRPDLPNRKQEKLQEVMAKCQEEGRKPAIFNHYIQDAHANAALFTETKPCLYTGQTSKENLKKGPDKKTPLLFKRSGAMKLTERGTWELEEDGTWAFDEKGYPIEDPNGKPMLALDYERLTFQETADRGTAFLTYKAGAQGSTWTRAKASIAYDLPDDCREEEQSEDRFHRIDNIFCTQHYIDYYRFIGKYPEGFLEEMDCVWVRKNEDGTYEEEFDEEIAEAEELPTAYELWFRQGTYDQYQNRKLAVQRQVSQLINNGICDEEILQEYEEEMPGLEV